MRQSTADRRVIEAEQQRRVNALPGLLRRAGAVLVFAKLALAAIAEIGNWRHVDWGKVAKQTFQKAVFESQRPRIEAAEAILRHSPACAGSTEEKIQKVLTEIRVRYPQDEPSQPQTKPTSKSHLLRKSRRDLGVCMTAINLKELNSTPNP